MEWIAYCTVCGELDRGPNGQWMEATARVHRRDTGHMTIVGHEPSIVLGGEMVEVSTEKQEETQWRGEWLHAKVRDTEMRGRITPTGIEFEQVSPSYDPLDLDKAVEIITEALKQRPSPRTYGDWVDLAEAIKDITPLGEWDTVNKPLQTISEEGPGAEEAKRWLIEKARELGIT